MNQLHVRVKTVLIDNVPKRPQNCWYSIRTCRVNSPMSLLDINLKPLDAIYKLSCVVCISGVYLCKSYTPSLYVFLLRVTSLYYMYFYCIYISDSLWIIAFLGCHGQLYICVHVDIISVVQIQQSSEVCVYIERC